MTLRRLPQLICGYLIKGKPCGKEPIRFFKNLRRNEYVGFCREHANEYPEGWAAFKPVSKEEAITHEVMNS
jgi:hypothetical protein